MTYKGSSDDIGSAIGSEEDIRSAFKSSVDGIMVSDNEGRVRLLNPALTLVTGLSTHKVLGRKAVDQVADGTVTDSATLRALEAGVPRTVRLWTAGNKEVVSTAVPVYDSRGCLKRIVCTVRNAGEFDATHHANHILQEPEDVQKSTIVAKSQKMLRLLDLADRIAAADVSVLITGETGVGKDVVARFIYNRSQRAANGAFIKLNCAAIPSALFESELFGYVKGAFTGALNTGKCGFVELAHKGILFLDEIGDLSGECQAKLLNVIEDHQVTRLGGRIPRGVDVRVVAATNKDLSELIEARSFRQDLYFRLAVTRLHIPPLRERREDIRPLLLHYLKIFAERYGSTKTLSNRLWKFFDTYTWPGNVRELAHLVECLFVITPGRVLEPDMLPDNVVSASSRRTTLPMLQGANHARGGQTLRQLVQEYEAGLVRETIAQAGSYVNAARLLGISLATLNRKVYKLKR